LSGGEKSRVALLRLLLKPINFLILAEPTNHLDMQSKDALLEALKDFGGTVVFVSHDRGFIQDLATRVLELKPGSARNFLGGYEYYLERVASEASGTVAGHNSDGSQNKNGGAKSSQAQNTAGGNSRQAQNASQAAASANPSQGQKSAAAISWEEQKKAANEKKRLERLVESLGAQIEETEKGIKALEEKMSDPAVYSNGAKATEVQKQIAAASAELDALNAQWEEAAEKLG
jgi:ATP-binding cassette subfamily F protein 3